MQYKKKTEAFKAIKWDGNNLKEIIELIGLHPSAAKWTWEAYEQVVKINGLKIFTPDALLVPIGDYIIKKNDGTIDTYKPDIFEALFEPDPKQKKKLSIVNWYGLTYAYCEGCGNEFHLDEIDKPTIEGWNYCPHCGIPIYYLAN